MNTRSTKAAHGSIYDTLFVARASRETFPSSSTATAPRSPVSLYDASQRREVPPTIQMAAVQLSASARDSESE